MTTFRLTIECDSDAFQDEEHGDHNGATRAEVSRILCNLAKYLAPGDSEGGKLYDVNGNAVGEWGME